MRTILLLLLTCNILAQSANWQNFGPNQRLETAAKLCLDSSNNIYFLANGDTNSFPGTKWQLYKLNPQGSIIWKKVYGQTGNYSAAQILYHNQKLYIAGERSWNDTDRAWIEVLDTSGSSIQHKFFGAGDTVVIGQDLAVNQQNQVALLNQIRVQSGANQGAQVLILDTNLNILARHLQTDTVDFVAHEIVGLAQGAWVYTSDYELPSRFDMLVSKISSNGQLQKRVVVSNGYTRGGNAIALNSKGQIVIGGEGASAFSVSFDITLTILDSNLNLLQDLYVRPGVPKNDACFDMAVTPYDTYLFTGYRIAPENGETEMIVVESDSLGNQLFIDNHSSSPTCIGSGIICDNQGNFFAAGSDFNQAPSLILALGQAKGLSLKNDQVSKVSVYPNPSGQVFHIDGIHNQTDWEVYNVQGQAFDFAFKANQISIEGPNGIYILKSRQTGSTIRLILNK